MDPELLDEFATLSGFLCHQAGEIPDQGDVVLVADTIRFDVLEADDRRLLSLRASNLSYTMGNTTIAVPVMPEGAAVFVSEDVPERGSRRRS